MYDLVLMAGSLPGVLGVLTVKARGLNCVCVAYTEDVRHVCRIFNVPYTHTFWNETGHKEAADALRRML